MTEPLRVTEPLHVVAGAILSGQRVLAAQRGRAMRETMLWEFPGGKIECGETSEAALRRELHEELDVWVGSVERLGEAITLGIRLELFSCHVERGVPRAKEHASLRWLAASELTSVVWAPADQPLLKLVCACLSRQRPQR